MKKRISWKVLEYNWHIKNENTKKIQELKKSII